MNWWRILTVAFWTFVVVMLAWQFYNYNNQVAALSESHPEQHYFYNPGPIASQTAPKGPDIRQIAYTVTPNSPQPGSFTVQFTVKNVGNITATSIQVKVRPYRGMILGDQDNPLPGGGGTGPVSDNDPISQYGQWVALPDLAPGQSSSNSMVFADQPNMTPTDGPKLDIIFVPVKTN